MYLASAILLAINLLIPAAASCGGMDPPVPGPVVQGFEPVGRYAGHWGVDYHAVAGTAVTAGQAGTVSFAGVVAGNRTITIDHGGGVKSSYSYLSSVSVEVGERIRRGAAIGLSGRAHGTDAVHFSVRVGGTYVDPNRLFSCSLLDPAAALRLVPVSRRSRSSAYPVG
ncbi:MAG: M23 family metallopeptidase [Acidimicrobiia bacterium]|nr:M23 family metallopeptidase [Acidimicrobiia bacterium]